jgi:hypothetical protein
MLVAELVPPRGIKIRQTPYPAVLLLPGGLGL